MTTDRGVQLTESFVSCLTGGGGGGGADGATTTGAAPTPRTTSTDGGDSSSLSARPLPIQSVLGLSRSDDGPLLTVAATKDGQRPRRRSECYRWDEREELQPVKIPIKLLPGPKLQGDHPHQPPPQISNIQSEAGAAHSETSSQPTTSRTRRFSINRGEQIVVIPPHWRCACSEFPLETTGTNSGESSVLSAAAALESRVRPINSNPSFEQSGFLASMELANDPCFQPRPWSPITVHNEHMERHRLTKRYNIPALNLRTPARVKPKSILKRDLVSTERAATARNESSLRFSVVGSGKGEGSDEGQGGGGGEEEEEEVEQEVEVPQTGAESIMSAYFPMSDVFENDCAARPWNESGEDALERLRSLSQSLVSSTQTKSVDPKYAQYFARVPDVRSTSSLISKQNGLCPHCNNGIYAPPSLPARWMTAVRETFGWKSQAEPSSTYTFVPSESPRASSLCAFTGLLFCHQCMSPNRMIIPSAVLSTWDFSTRSVSEPAAQLLNRYFETPLLSVRQIHPAVKRIVATIHKVHTIRRELLSLKDFFLLGRKYSESCTASVDSEGSWHGGAHKPESRNSSTRKDWESNDYLPCETGTRRFCSSLMRELVPRLPGEYWIMSSDLYSLTDLVAINLYHERLQEKRHTFEIPNPFQRLEGILRCREEPPTARVLDSRTPCSSHFGGGAHRKHSATSESEAESELPILRVGHQEQEDPADAFLSDLEEFTIFWENHVMQDCAQCHRGFDKFKLTGGHNLTMYARH